MDATRQPLSGTERDLILTRIIDAPREKPFRAWTEPALLKKRFTPRPWSVARAETDVRPGGSSRTHETNHLKEMP